MSEASEVLMTTGTMAHCPDCREERLFVAVVEGEHCCTDCGAAVFALEVRAPQPVREQRRVSRSA